MAQKSQTKSLFTADLVVPAIQASFVKLNPRELIRNPVMFVTAAVAALMTVLLVVGQDDLTTGFKLQLVVWLWLTVLFGTFAEALAEGRGKAQAASLRATKAELTAKRLKNGRTEQVPASQLRAGDLVLVETNDLIPADGEVVEGVASVNEAAITGESAPVIREAGGDRSAVTAGTRVISDQVTVRVTVDPGQGFLDRMIALVEGAERQKTPNEIALTLLLVGLTIIFLIAAHPPVSGVTRHPPRRFRASIFSTVSSDSRRFGEGPPDARAGSPRARHRGVDRRWSGRAGPR